MLEIIIYFWKKSKVHICLTLENLPLDLILPCKRWETLLTQAKRYQEANCLYHINDGNIRFSLYKDHTCVVKSFPHKKRFSLDDHTDEVWFAAFSNDGNYLATGSKDGTIIVWDVKVDGVVSIRSRNKPNSDGVCHISWSHCDSYYVSCAGKSAFLWDNRVICLIKHRMQIKFSRLMVTRRQ